MAWGTAAAIGIPLAFRGLEGFFQNKENKKKERKEEEQRRLQALIQSLSPKAAGFAGGGLPGEQGQSPGLSMLSHFNDYALDPLTKQIVSRLS